MLLNQNVFLALVAPLTLIIVFFLNDKFQDKKSTIFCIVFSLIAFILVQSLLIFLDVIPEGSPNHRMLLRCVLVSIIPLIFLTARRQAIRNIIAINFLVLLLGLVLAEAAMTVISPKRVEQQKWSDLVSQFSDAPKKDENPTISMEDQYRLVTGQPTIWRQRIFFYGGSTTFNGEVSDEDTYASQTQRMLSIKSNSVKVENRGFVGAAATDLAFLLEIYEADDTDLTGPFKGHIMQRIKRGDVVVFYIGVNEAKTAIVYQDPITRLSLKFPKFGETTNWFFKRTNIGYALSNVLTIDAPTIDENSLAETKTALESANKFVTERGGVFIPVVQPHAFTKSKPNSYEQAIKTHMGKFPEAVDSVYPRLADLILQFENSADGRKIFDKAMSSPYFDWCHVNKKGNQDIAEFMANVLEPFIIKIK